MIELASHETPRRTAAWELLLCGVLLTATLLNYADRQALPAAAVAIKSDLRLNNEQYGKVEGIFGLAFGVGALVGGALADWISVRWLYPAAMLIWSAAGAASGFAEGFAGLWLSRLVLGFFEAIHWPCSLRTTQRVFAPARRTLANSLLQGGAPIGAILTAALVLSLVTDRPGGWRMMFWCLGALGVPWAALWLSTVRTADFERPVMQATDVAAGQAPIAEVAFWRLILDRRFWLLVLVVICINTSWHYVRVWMPIVLEEQLGYARGDVQRVFIGYWAATFFGSLAAGGLAAWLGRTRGVHAARMIVFFSFSVITALMAVAAFLPPSREFIALMWLIGFGALGMFPVFYSLAQEVTAEHQGKMGGLLGFVAWVVLYFAHPAIGRLMDHSPGSRPYVFAGLGLLPLVASVMLIMIWPASRTSDSRGA
jgi:ACS family hexuronate transporter-like MFS transporter